jgi:cardiolipin-specific phospholipase
MQHATRNTQHTIKPTNLFPIMLNFWSSESETFETLRAAEAKLVEYAKKFGDRDPDSFEIVLKDTPFPADVLPLKKSKKTENQDLVIHSATVTSKHKAGVGEGRYKTPLVLLHGYANGALYFYRNIVGLSNFFETVHSLDTLGCGLSSRCPDLLYSDAVDTSTETTEEIFVESLEAWRVANGIGKMILAGHSIGGYISVAYCEKYPQNVEHLVLLSPAGVSKANPEKSTEFYDRMPLSRRLLFSSMRQLFDYGVTPPSFLRMLSTARGSSLVGSYIQNRLPSIKEPEEQQILTDYLYSNAVLTGSGENMLSRFLTSSAHGRIPTVDRIPKLKVPKVSFMYGDHDWMDIEGGLQAWKQSQKINGPRIDVFKIQNAGHLLMLDNWRGFHAGIITMCGGNSTLSPHYPMPMRCN